MDTHAQPIEQDLAIAIAQTRGGQRAGDIARELIQRDCHVLELVGLLPEAERAAYYEGAMWTLRFVPLESEQANKLTTGSAQYIGHRDDFKTYVRENAGGWPWVHPRYRWLLDVSETDR